jgi:two-component system, cell cycle response regulator
MKSKRPDLTPQLQEIEKLRSALRKAESEVQRLLDEAAARGALVDILHDVMGSLSMGELFHMLARRLARALNLSHSSVIFAKSGDRLGTVASAHEDPQLENLQVELDKYPEIEAALASEQPILIPDIWHSDSYKSLREAWEKDGSVISVRSIIALPFRLDLDRTGVFLLRRTAEKSSLNEADVDFAETVVKSAMNAMRRAHMVEVTQADNLRLEALARTDPLTQLLNRAAQHPYDRRRRVQGRERHVRASRGRSGAGRSRTSPRAHRSQRRFCRSLRRRRIRYRRSGDG